MSNNFDVSRAVRGGVAGRASRHVHDTTTDRARPGETAFPHQITPRESSEASGPGAATPVIPVARAPWTGSQTRVPADARPNHDAGPVASVVAAGAFSAWLRCWGLHLELALALTVGVAFAVTDSTPVVALTAFLVWVVGAFYRGRAVTTPLVHQLRVVASSALLPLALLAVGVGVLGVSPAALPHAIMAVFGAAAVTAVSRGLRWSLQAPVRVIVVGDRASVATSVTQLPLTSNSRVVGAVIVEEGLDATFVPPQILGVPCSADLGEIRSLVGHRRADLVVVDPGRGVSADDFRTLTWALEGQRVAIGVSGVIRSIAPHRLASGKLGRATILDVKPAMQSKYVRGVKFTLDRVIGALALVAVSPLLAALMVAVRWETPGPALFKQTRVGHKGKTFTVYKLRTMVADAEARKPALGRDNEFDSVLFKVRQDPRITPLGAYLRKFSLDELPQLINVVRGEMSLVGPRPHLPEEVELMDDETRRRHAVRPGLTGLWQVSGRSDLSWDESADLDAYYADNWNLSADASILARTVRAVLGSKGAY